MSDERLWPVPFWDIDPGMAAMLVLLEIELMPDSAPVSSGLSIRQSSRLGSAFPRP